jgi:integrase
MMKNGTSKNGIRKRYRKDGTIYWEARATLHGKRTQFYGDTKGEAQRNREEAKRLIDKGLPLPDNRLTVEAYLASWLEKMQSQIRPTTWKRYKELVTQHMLPTLGYVPLGRLTGPQVDHLYRKVLPGHISDTTIHHVHAVLHKALKDALRLGLVAYNAAEMLDPPKMPHHEMACWSPDEVNQFLDFCARDRLEAAYVLGATSGMREGEILALKWADIHLDAPEPWLHVGATLHYGREREGETMHFYWGKPKSRHGTRDILLHPLAIDALRRHAIRQKEERLKQGPLWDTSDERYHDLVFTNTVGHPIDAGHFLKRAYYPLLEQAGLPRIRFHDLRHTAGTILMQSDTPILTTSRMLGHATAAFTMDRYGHVRLKDQKVAVKEMERVLGRK